MGCGRQGGGKDNLSINRQKEKKQNGSDGMGVGWWKEKKVSRNQEGRPRVGK